MLLLIMMGKKGCLLIHGLTGSPKNLETLAHALKAEGFTVRLPVLHGHDGDFSRLSRTTWPQWYQSLKEAYNGLAKETDEIYFVGLSMGALLGMHLAAETGNGLKAAVFLAPPFIVRPLFRFLVIPGVRYTPLRFFIRSVAKNFEKSVLDPKGREFYRNHSFARMPARGVFSTQDLAHRLKKELGKIRQPLLLVVGEKDHLVDPKTMEAIERGVASRDVQTVLLKNSGHVLPVDYEREALVKYILEFFRNASSAPQTASAATGT